jgi:ankyrin repeat protein
MKIDFKKIINIKNKQQLKAFKLDKPIFDSNYLFHYLVIIGNLDALKLDKFPVYLENNDGLNAFHLAAKENQIEILHYLIDNYPDYIYNKNKIKELFTGYLQFEEFNNLIKKYPNLDWNELLNDFNKNISIVGTIINNLNYKQLKEFISLTKFKPKNKYQYLFGIIKNINLKKEEIIKILDLFTDEDLNIKDNTGGGLLIQAIINNDEDLVKYLINRNIDVDYHTFNNTDNPLIVSLFTDIINNQFILSKIIIKELSKINSEFLKKNNKFLDNPLHSLFYIRMNRMKQIVSAEKMKNINYLPDLELLKHSTSENWNQLNIEKLTPFHLITNLDYNVYSKFFDKSNIQISKSVLNDIKDHEDKKWIKLFEKLDEYKEPQNDINLTIDEYSHYTIFQATFKDVAIFSIYLSNTYTDLLVPNLKSYELKNITFEDTFPFSDNIIKKEPIFPWIISYYNENEYYIHPYLNNIINAHRRSGNKRFACVFLSLIYEKTLHANLLVYDLKNMTVERFEPYGNTMQLDGNIDEVLEEELTWNTGLKYIKPEDYLPVAGFQTISDENNLINKKSGDFGGFCLAWCLWYLETKMKNPDVSSKILVDKVINKISKLDYKFSEYIRNYSNKINSKRIEYLEQIGIDSKKISDNHMTEDTSIKVTNFLIESFTNIN